MHKGDVAGAYDVWRRIRGTDTMDSREEFFVMKVSLEEEEEEIRKGRTRRFPWMDFFT